MGKQITATHHLRFQNMAPLTIHIPPAVPITSQPSVQGIRDPPVLSEDLTTSATIEMTIVRTRSVPNSIRNAHGMRRQRKPGLGCEVSRGAFGGSYGFDKVGL
jgi:hypothetical protein